MAADWLVWCEECSNWVEGCEHCGSSPPSRSMLLWLGAALLAAAIVGGWTLAMMLLAPAPSPPLGKP